MAQIIYDAYGDQLYKKEWFEHPAFKSFMVSQLDQQMVGIVSLYLTNRTLFLMNLDASNNIAGKLEDLIFKIMDATGPLDDRGYMCHIHTLSPPVHTLLEQQLGLCEQMMGTQ